MKIVTKFLCIYMCLYIFLFIQLDEIKKLSPLNNLEKLDVKDNTICNLCHCFGFIVFHLRSLNTIDGQDITQEERKLADNRFNQGIEFINY